MEGTLMKKRLIALLLVLAMLIPAGIASAASWYRVNTTSLKVRYMPSESAKVLGSYRRDYAATIQSTKDGWSYVKFSNGFTGYVQTKYLSKASSYSAWIASDNTSLRKGPDGGFAASATLARGTKVTVLSHGAKYDYVNAGSFGYGYVVNSLLSKKKVSASGNASKSNEVSGGGYDAWVLNSGYRTVNLRKDPSTNSPVIKSYATGTKAYVIASGSEWSKVKIGSNTGWMMTRFLSTSEPAETATPKPASTGSSTYTAYVVSANRKAVNVRRGGAKGYSVAFKVNHGAAVKVLKHGTSWDKIEYNGQTGYILNSFLQLSKPSDPVPETTKASSSGPSLPATRTISTPDHKSVNFHRGMGDSYANVNGVGRLQDGWTVTVLEYNGRWAKVQYNGYTGWIHSEFLK